MEQLYDYNLPNDQMLRQKSSESTLSSPKKLVQKVKNWINLVSHKEHSNAIMEHGYDFDLPTDLNEEPGNSTVITEQANKNETYLELVNDSFIQQTFGNEYHENMFTTQFVTHLNFKNVTCNKLRKRLDGIANKKQIEVKHIRKFINDINQWSNNPLFQNDITDTHLVIKQITTLFMQDIKYQENIIGQLKAIVNNLEYISLKETDLINDHKRLVQENKKYNHIKLKKGDIHPETNFSKDRLLTAEHIYESMKTSFQKTISITMRQLFQDLSYEYYSCSEDMKLVSSGLIKDFMMSLESHNYQKFTDQLEQLRKKRDVKIWSNFSNEDKQNRIKWENLRTGVYEKNDSLLQDIYKNIPSSNYCSTGLRRVNSFPSDMQLKPTFEDLDASIDLGMNLNSQRPELNSHGSDTGDKYHMLTSNTFLSSNKDIRNSATILRSVDPNICGTVMQKSTNTKLQKENTTIDSIGPLKMGNGNYVEYKTTLNEGCDTPTLCNNHWQNSNEDEKDELDTEAN